MYPQMWYQYGCDDVYFNYSNYNFWCTMKPLYTTHSVTATVDIEVDGTQL
jgi:hypothetical protein